MNTGNKRDNQVRLLLKFSPTEHDQNDLEADY